MAAGGHFGWPKMTFDRISHHFRSICNFFLFIFQNGRRRPFWKSIFGSPFGWPNITIDCISRHFRSIHNFPFFYYFSKWPPVTILEVRFVQVLACGGGGGDGGATKNIIPPKYSNFGDIIITTLYCKQVYRYLPLYIYIYITFEKKHPIV